MYKLRLLLLMITLASGGLSAASTSIEEVWIFATHNQTFSNKHAMTQAWVIKRYNIDSNKALETQLSQGLSHNPATAEVQIRQQLNNKQLKQQIKQAWQGTTKAQSLGITKVPAITFDKGKTVIYGVFDLLEAYRLWYKKTAHQ